MSRLLGIVALYLIMFLAWIAAGLFMLFAPARIGNLIHDSFGLYPEVRKQDWLKKLILRVIGAGLLGFAINFAHRIVLLVNRGG